MLGHTDRVTVTPTSIAGLFVVDREVHTDGRGFFRESYRHSELEEAVGRPVAFRQANHSRSAVGVLRGIHVEPWDKLVYVVRGTALCVVADVRPESATFGSTEAFLLGDEPGRRRRLFIAEGLGNGFQAVTEADYVNEVSKEFSPLDRRGVAWDDPTLGIEWPILPPTLSAADAAQPLLQR